MDGKGRRKVNIILVASIIAVLLFITGAFLYMGTGLSVSQEQMEEMLVMHPEMSEEIVDSFRHYEQERWLGRASGLIVILLAFLALPLGFLLDRKREQRKIEEEHKENLLALEKQTNKNLLVLRDRLKQEENATKALITDISHQLKTPLASLKLSFEMTQEDGISEEERKEFIEKEKEEIDKLEVLLSELVNLSRLESRMIQLHPERTELRDTISDAVNRVYVKARAKDIEMELEDEESISVLHDARWTAEALVNILDNAVKYSGEHTRILIRVSSQPNLVLIEVEDEGIGIANEELNRIFQRFYRGKEAKRMTPEGAGVGLYLTRWIIEEQGGTVTAKRKKKGTIMRLTLPR